ncbi:MAG: hypothetical protein Q7S76_00330 [bacterium]|nr:hypothetical protein [bacterium]
MNKNHIMIFAGLLLGIHLLARPAQAQTCTTQYGGQTTCTPADLVINKEVLHPTTGLFVENLGVSKGETFGPDTSVLFRLTIQNQSGETFHPVTVRDIFPPHITFESGPGTYDSGSRTLTFTLENLTAGETRRIEILGKVAGKDALATLPTVFCEVNTGKATAPARPDGDEDTAQVCIGKAELKVTELPVAGFNDLALLVPFVGIGVVGIAILKKGR